MSALPSTIKHPDTFLRSPSAGFDGVFDWSWTAGCFGAGKIAPMDFDGVIERKGNFLVFETKDFGVPVPKGQLFTYKSAHELGVFTIVFIEGKTRPERAKVWCQTGFKNGLVMDEHKPIDDLELFRGFVADWYAFADKNPRARVDTTFLNKRIASMNQQVAEVKQRLAEAVAALGGKVTWA